MHTSYTTTSSCFHCLQYIDVKRFLLNGHNRMGVLQVNRIEGAERKK